MPLTRYYPGFNAAKSYVIDDDVIKWNHFPRYWPFVRGIHRSPVNYPHKGQWRGALMFSLICARINGWVNNHEAGDLRRNRAHYDVIVMRTSFNRQVLITQTLSIDLFVWFKPVLTLRSIATGICWLALWHVICISGIVYMIRICQITTETIRQEYLCLHTCGFRTSRNTTNMISKR